LPPVESYLLIPEPKKNIHAHNRYIEFLNRLKPSVELD
jgi:hypothetical protein